MAIADRELIYGQAMAFYKEGHLLKARAVFEYLLSVDDTDASSLHMLGFIAMQEGNNQKALELISQAITLRPNYINAHCDLGTVMQNLNRFEDALAQFDIAIAIQPDLAIAHGNRANALLNLNRFDDALGSYARAIDLNPKYVNAILNRGRAMLRLERYDDALTDFDRALTFAPDYAVAHQQRAIALRELNRVDESITSFRRAIAYGDHSLDTHTALANILLRAGRLEEAIQSYRLIIEKFAATPELLSNMGTALLQSGRGAEAVDCYNKALAIDPQFVQGYYNRGVAQQEFGQLDAALQDYNRVIELNPSAVSAQWNKSLILLLQGKYEEGFRLHEWRWKSEQFRRARKPSDFPQPMWDGSQSLSGKTIVLHGEQGLGDTLQFCRYAALVKALGATVILEVAKPLLTLLQSLQGVDRLVQKGQLLPAFDFHCPLLSLPMACHTELESIPRQTAYLRSDVNKVIAWGRQLGPKQAIRIGLAWSGNPKHLNDEKRSIALKSIPKMPAEFEYFCLQRDIRMQDRVAMAQHQIRDFSEQLDDFADTAALCSHMDLIVTVDTSLAHLAGALGRPTWILLPNPPDWRWMIEREDSPWYPSVSLFRQTRPGYWDDVWQKIWGLARKQFNSNRPD